jgi:MFS family permease
MRRRQTILAVALSMAVALAFADASVVALALPDLYAEFDTTIVGVSWVLTTYALVVAVTAVPVALLHKRLRPLPLLVSGIVVFTGASLVAGASGSLPLLLVARCGQGVGATLLLAGSLPVLAAITGGEERARRWWAAAAAVGAAIGPALGGVLTQLFDWRAIFFVQAPIVAVALVVLVDPAVRSLHEEGRIHGRSETTHRDVIVSNIGFALVFAALVGALFLGVLLAIEVWRYSPIEGALLVTALPVGMLVGRTMTSAPRVVAGVGGALLLAGGLVGLALLPGEEPVLAGIALALCGIGFDLVGEVLGPAAVPSDAPAVRAATVSVGARHAGLVLGLIVIAPVLATSLEAGADRATLGATRSMLEAELELRVKLPVTWALRTAIDDAPRGQVPDLAAVFDERGADEKPALAAARDGLLDTITDAITRSFRPAFGVAALLAAGAAIPALAISLRRRAAAAPAALAPRARGSAIAVGAVGVVAVVLFAVELTNGARDVGEFAAVDPCTAPPDTYPGSGLDAVVQRIGLSALNGAACELGTTRERFVLSLDPNSGYDDVSWDEETAEQALRAGAHRAIDDADERDSLPGLVASALRFVVDRAPIGWLIERLPLPGS